MIPHASPASRAKAAGLWLGAFAFLWLILAQLFLSFPILYDTDSYFHLSVGRLYAESGWVDTLPWARFSALHDGFGDKEFLFHVSLQPFAGGASPEVGGRWALAFWNALVIVTLAAAGRRLAGRWGLLAPLMVYAGSFDFLNRLIRLRPETPALLLFIAAAWCVGARRFRLLGVVAFAFTLSYTAFHALLGLCGLWFLMFGLLRGRWYFQLPTYPLLGTLAALWLHPHFPHNLVIWKIQSIDFFRYKGVLDVGEEIAAQPTDVVLGYIWPWLVAVAVLIAVGLAGRGSSQDQGEAEPWRRDTRDALILAALIFAGLYLLMLRFSTHFLPLATLAVLAWMGPVPVSALTARRRLSLIAALVLAMGFGVWRSTDFVSKLATDLPQGSKEGEWAAFGRAVPTGAKVAAGWGNAQTYSFWAPQGRYLNVLDPVFMAVPYPQIYDAQRQVFEGQEPDVPRVLAEVLDSDFLAASRSHKHPQLFERLRHDPRIAARYQSGTLLFELRPGRNQRFVLDWRLVPKGTELPLAADMSIDAWPAYPLLTDAKLRSLEAYVDGRRFGEARCLALAHDFTVSEAETRHWELAPFGPITLWLDDRLLVSSQGTLEAYLGRGLRLSARVEAGDRRLTVLTCKGESVGEGESEHNGFYLIDRTPQSP